MQIIAKKFLVLFSKRIKSGIAEKTLNLYVITRSFAKAKRRGDLKIIITDVATAPS